VSDRGRRLLDAIKRLWLTVVYLGLAIASLAVSRTGQSVRSVSIVTAVAFVVGLGWAVTRPNLKDSKLSWAYLLVIALLGSTLLFYELWRADHRWFGYVAVALLYLGFAGMVARLRRCAHTQLVGVCLLVLGVLAVYLGFVLLAQGIREWSSAALGPGIGLLIAGVDLAAHGSSKRPDSPHISGRAALIVATTLFLASAVVLSILSGSLRGGVLIVAIVALLSLAYVSRTPADVVVVVALIALFGATRPEQSLPGPDLSPNPSRLLSLGDSYMSGEGARVFYEGTDEAGGNQCRRSPTAYAAQIPHADLGFTSVVFLACSGAVASQIDETTQGGTTGPQLAQYQALKRPHVNLVLVGIGGNDAGFSHIGEACLAPGNCDVEMTKLFLHNLPVVETNIEAALNAVHKAVPGVPIVAVPYPAPFASASKCNGLLLSGQERAFLSTFLADLDQEVHKAAAATHSYFLAEMEDSLATMNLQLCAPHPSVHHCSLGFSADHGLNFVHLQSVAGFATQRFNPANWVHDSLHPNPCGHDADLAAFKTWYAKNRAHLQPMPSFKPVAAPPGVAGKTTCMLANSPPAADAAAAQTVVKNPPHVTTCESESVDWALRQVADAGLYLFALLALLAAALGWLWIMALRRVRRVRLLVDDEVDEIGEPDEVAAAVEFRRRRLEERFTGVCLFLLASIAVVASL
jgi:lysophospholipase L1-like esterase